MKAIINAKLYDYHSYIELGYVLFEKEIVEVGPMSEFENHGYEVIDFKGDILLPSFVCAHSHIYSIFARGLALPFAPKNFQDILDQMWWKIDKKIDNQITFYSGIAAAYEFLQNGVTTVIDHHASGAQIMDSLEELRKAISHIGHMRGIYCFETSDRFDPSACIKENIKFAIENHDQHAASLFGMHASMSLSDQTLEMIRDRNKNLPIHVHVAESKMDEDDCESNCYKSVIERFDEYGLIKPNSLIVHGVHMNDTELQIIKDRGAYIVVNTSSNMNNAVGLPNVRKYLDFGIPVMVGNDGLSTSMANEYLNVLYASHLVSESPVALNINDVKQMIINSNEYASYMLGIKLGRFIPGYKADFMRIAYTPFTELNESNIFGHIFYGVFPGFKPREVYCSGQQEINDYKITNKRLLGEFEHAKEFADRLWKKVKEEN